MKEQQDEIITEDQIKEQGLKNSIMEATIAEFSDKGFKFTMDDIAKRLSISKKTIYNVFEDKETLFLKTADYIFDDIKISEDEVLKDETLSTLEKIRKILIVLPDKYKNLDFRQIYQLQNSYPKIYLKIKDKLESGWESTIDLLERGIDEGCLRNFSIPVFKTIFEASLERFLGTVSLIDNNISYEKAIDEMLYILVTGIENK